jgi:hypothetical protein
MRESNLEKQPAVTINTNWMTVLVGVVTIAGAVLSAGWWMSGIRAKAIIESWARENEGVSAQVQLYVQQNTVTKEEFKDFKRSMDYRLDGITGMLQTIGNNQTIMSGGKTKPLFQSTMPDTK